MANSLIPKQNVGSIYQNFQSTTKGFTITFRGIYSKSKAHEIIRANALNCSIDKYQLDLESIKITGNFLINDYHCDAHHNDFHYFSATMQSTGEFIIEENIIEENLL